MAYQMSHLISYLLTKLVSFVFSSPILIKSFRQMKGLFVRRCQMRSCHLSSRSRFIGSRVTVHRIRSVNNLLTCFWFSFFFFRIFLLIPSWKKTRKNLWYWEHSKPESWDSLTTSFKSVCGKNGLAKKEKKNCSPPFRHINNNNIRYLSEIRWATTHDGSRIHSACVRRGEWVMY